LHSVLHITEVIKGGIASYIDELYLYHKKNSNIQFHFFISQQEVNELKHVDKKLISTFEKKERSIFFFIRYFFGLLNLLLIKKPKVIHCHSSFAGFFVRFIYLFKILNRPTIIYTPHSWSFMMDVSNFKKNLYINIEKLLSNVTTKIICVSKYEYEIAVKVGIDKNKMIVIYNGVIDKISIKNPKKNHFNKNFINCLFVGRLDFQKGIDVLLSSFSKLNDSYKLHIVGEKVLNNLNIENNDKCIFHGWVSREDIDFYYKNCDILIVPSRWDGLPIVPLEAMKNSKPLVVSDIGPLKELLNGKNGLIFKKGDINSLLDALNRIPDCDLKAMGNESRQIFKQNFDSIITNKQLNLLYEKYVS